MCSTVLVDLAKEYYSSRLAKKSSAKVMDVPVTYSLNFKVIFGKKNGE